MLKISIEATWNGVCVYVRVQSTACVSNEAYTLLHRTATTLLTHKHVQFTKWICQIRNARCTELSRIYFTNSFHPFCFVSYRFGFLLFVIFLSFSLNDISSIHSIYSTNNTKHFLFIEFQSNTGSALFRDGICERWRFNVSNSTMRKVQGASSSVSKRFRLFFPRWDFNGKRKREKKQHE